MYLQSYHTFTPWGRNTVASIPESPGARDAGVPIYQNFPNTSKMHEWHPSKLGPTSGSRDDIVRTYIKDQNCRTHHELHLCLIIYICGILYRYMWYISTCLPKSAISVWTSSWSFNWKFIKISILILYLNFRVLVKIFKEYSNLNRILHDRKNKQDRTVMFNLFKYMLKIKEKRKGTYLTQSQVFNCQSKIIQFDWGFFW